MSTGLYLLQLGAVEQAQPYLTTAERLTHR
jgi:hypothetical protein